MSVIRQDFEDDLDCDPDPVGIAQIFYETFTRRVSLAKESIMINRPEYTGNQANK